MPEYLTSFRKSVFSLMPAFSFQHFRSKTELLSYLILCVTKMPFVPLARPRSMSGLTGGERPADGVAFSVTARAQTKAPVENKSNSVTQRLASNLRQLGRMNQPGCNLPTGKGMPKSGIAVKSRDPWIPSSQTFSSSMAASSSGDSMSNIQQSDHWSHRSSKAEPEPKLKTRRPEEARFTLTLTPEVVLLLQRRSKEKQQRLAARSTGDRAGSTSSNSDPQRRRGNPSKPHQPAARHSTLGSRAAVKNNGDMAPGDISSLLKISLLNERYKYDDVEYEEEEEHCGVDERVVLKCTEWLRGLENAPVTFGNKSNKSESGLKVFQMME